MLVRLFMIATVHGGDVGSKDFEEKCDWSCDALRLESFA